MEFPCLTKMSCFIKLAKPLIGTQASSLNSPLTDTSVAPDETLPRPHVEAGDSAVLAGTGDLLDVRLLVADNMLFGVYQDWVHKNSGNNLYGGITEDGKWLAR